MRNFRSKKRLKKEKVADESFDELAFIAETLVAEATEIEESCTGLAKKCDSIGFHSKQKFEAGFNRV